MLKSSSLCIPWVVGWGSLQVEVQYFISFPSFSAFMPQNQRERYTALSIPLCSSYIFI